MEILSKNSGHTTSIPYKNWHGKPYYSLDAYCKNTYGEKLYKVALPAPTEMVHQEQGAAFSAVQGEAVILPPPHQILTAPLNKLFYKVKTPYPERKPVRNLLLTFRLTPTPTVLFPIWKKYTGLPLRSLLLREFPLPPGRTVCLTMLWRCYAG